MRRSLPLILVSAAVVIAVSILAWQTWLTFAPTPSKSTTRPTARSNDASSPTAPPKVVKRDPTGKIIKPGHDPNPDRLRSLDNPEPVKVKLSGVMRFESPLHANAPGRMPDKEGERSLGRGTLLPNLQDYSVYLSGSDAVVSSWIGRWVEQIRVEKDVPTAIEAADLVGTSLSPFQIAQIGRSIRFVEGEPQSGLGFFRAVVSQCRVGSMRGDSTTLELESRSELEALRMVTRPIWDVEDYQTAATVFKLLSCREAEGSFKRFRAIYLKAESFYMYAIRNEDADAASSAVRSVDAMLRGETGGYIPTDFERHEIVWAMGSSLYAARRFEDALPYLEQASTFEKLPFTESARLHYIGALAKTKQIDVARTALEKFNLSPAFHEQALIYFE